MIIRNYTEHELWTAAANLIDAYNDQRPEALSRYDLGVIIGWLINRKAIKDIDINMITGDITSALICDGPDMATIYHQGQMSLDDD